MVTEALCEGGCTPLDPRRLSVAGTLGMGSRVHLALCAFSAERFSPKVWPPTVSDRREIVGWRREPIAKKGPGQLCESPEPSEA